MKEKQNNKNCANRKRSYIFTLEDVEIFISYTNCYPSSSCLFIYICTLNENFLMTVFFFFSRNSNIFSYDFQLYFPHNVDVGHEH